MSFPPQGSIAPPVVKEDNPGVEIRSGSGIFSIPEPYLKETTVTFDTPLEGSYSVFVTLTFQYEVTGSGYVSIANKSAEGFTVYLVSNIGDHWSHPPLTFDWIAIPYNH